MASLGIRRFGDLVGRTELLRQTERHRSLEGELDRPRPAARRPGARPSTRRAASSAATPRSSRSAPPSTSASCSARRAPAIESGTKVSFETTVTNIDLAVGGRVSNALVVARGADGLPDDTIDVHAERLRRADRGRLARPGVTINVNGDVNDYAGKGMSGGILAVRPATERGLQGRAQRDRRQRRPLRRDRRQGVLPRPRRRALRGPQLRRAGGRRGDRRARLRVHDRRLRRRPRPDRPQLRRRDERRDRLHLGSRRRVPRRGATWAWSSSSRSIPRATSFLHDLVAEHQRRTGSAVAAGLLDRWDEAAEEFVVVIPPGFRAALAHTVPPAKGRTINLA